MIITRQKSLGIFYAIILNPILISLVEILLKEVVVPICNDKLATKRIIVDLCFIISCNWATCTLFCPSTLPTYLIRFSDISKSKRIVFCTKRAVLVILKHVLRLWPHDVVKFCSGRSHINWYWILVTNEFKLVSAVFIF